MMEVKDICVLSIASFLGNVGVALTGFGMAIIFLFFYQIIVLSGYEGNFKYAVFIQALALFSAQPLLLKKAEVTKHASWEILRYFIPVTILSTPIGQLTGDIISTDLIELVAGFLVTFVAVFEMYQKREAIAKRCRKWCCRALREDGDEDLDDEENQCPNRDTLLSSYKTLTSSITNDISDEKEMDVSGTTGGCFLDNFELSNTLGNGAISVVKEGIQKFTKKSFAIKIVAKVNIIDKEYEQLQEEISLLRELNHKNLLSVREAYDEPDAFYLVFDLMHGGDLLTRLNHFGFFPEKEAHRIAKTLLDVVRYIHRHNIVHRDLKPENILLESAKPNCLVKLADFGFAKREVTPDSLTTLCGTPGYVAPEILIRESYGCKADMWSFGVLCWVMLAGYQPFRGDTQQEVNDATKKGEYVFDEEFWKNVSNTPKEFISSLLVSDPRARMAAEDAQCHPWLSDEYMCKDAIIDDTTQVFFMIGSQRSGSNWLRTMLDEREDLGGPHPPHIMRDFMPIIEKFGDLSIDENFRILVDHVCTFVERNQVPWTDKHGCNINFRRPIVYALSSESCKRIRNARHTDRNGNEAPLCEGMYLLSIFDAIMTYYTKVNGKRLWMCKSMGMSQFHDLLLEFYGPNRLRYIYLVRDPRDVAMSFMKTPVGDCHWYEIITKWTRLQHSALRILNECPELIYKLYYENILTDRENELERLYDFVGERRFGGVKRTASVICMDTTESIVNRAKDGRESFKARSLSYQFVNLGRGKSFVTSQNQKWRHPETGLKTDEIQIIETVAHEVMEKLGYQTHLVAVTTKPSSWSDHDLAVFKQLNQEGIVKMNKDLAMDNPDDLARRMYQTAALKLSPIYRPADWVEIEVTFDEIMSGTIRSILHEEELLARRDIGTEKICSTNCGIRFRWACGTQRGYYADQHDKLNQDSWTAQIITGEQGKSHWFAVYDGNGREGHKCSQFASKEIYEDFQKRMATGVDVHTAVEKAHMEAHKRLLANDTIDSKQSGTTAATVLLVDDKCIVSNVGDSSIVLGWKGSGPLCGEKLSRDHTPKCAEERNRIKRLGGIVMTTDQRDGLVPMREHWSDYETPRVWSDEITKHPGCAFTRSIGNEIAHRCGVVSRPELFEHQINRHDRVLIVASDGVTEYMDEQTCVQITCTYNCPSKAAEALIREASDHWKSRGDHMDDITAIVIFFDNEDRDSETLGEDGNLRLIVHGDKIGTWAGFWTLFSGFLSGFLGGLCGIRGPPVILYFLHPPHPVYFDKKSQRATGAVITATNVGVRVVFYLVETLALETNESYFARSDWPLYICIVISAIAGVLVGSKLFDMMKDSRNNIRLILSVFLLLCGVSLLISSFHF